MKAKELISSQLKSKRRTESDLIRYLQTRDTSDTCNYSLLLGAGASVTSGIKTAKELVDKWTIELYERYSENTTDSLDIAETYLNSNQGSWYNPLNKYSSLFEKKFDLPSQRRRFVEQEVDQKLPSIGYAYLTSLCEKNFFNTIFTTNFDDLVNEAFYQFSNIRPTHCAHDSSISAVSLSSKRPKIIKVHGDYLFNDIKSTLRETESLEKNTKEKFGEFCKEYGLIVIGYAGNDRSVMDVLDFLVKQDNYLSNGIYWCLREDDYISQDLKNLLWKEKVYPVIIEGFDEFMAKLHHNLTDEKLNLTPNSSESKLKKTISQILNDDFNLSRIPEIDEDIDYLKNETDRSDVSLLLSDLTFGDEKNTSLKTSTLKELMEIDAMIKNGNLDNAKKIAEEKYRKHEGTDQEISFIQRLLTISKKLSDEYQEKKWVKKLLDIDPNNISYILYNSETISDLEDKIKYLQKMKSNITPSFSFLNRLASSINQLSERAIKEIEKKENIEQEISILEQSIRLEPSPNNPAHRIRINLLVKLYNIYNEPEKNGITRKIEESINELNEVCNTHRELCFIKLKILSNSSDKISKIIKERFSEILELLISTFRKSSNSEKDNIQERILNFASNELYNERNIISLREIFNSEIISYDGNECLKSIKIAEYEIYINADEKASEKEIKKSLNCQETEDYIKDILDLSIIIGGEIKNEAFDRYRDIKQNLDSESIHFCEISVLDSEKKYKECADLVRNRSKELNYDKYGIETRTFFLIKAQAYEETINLIQKHMDYAKSEQGEVAFINYCFAMKKIKKDLPSNEITHLRNILAKSDKPAVKACAELILGKTTQQLKNNLSDDITSSIKTLYTYKTWPIIEDKTVIKEAAKLASKKGINYIEGILG